MNKKVFRMQLTMVVMLMLLATEWSGATAKRLEPDAGASQSDQAEEFTRTRIPFVRNEGQADDRVAFYAQTFAGTVFVTREGSVVTAVPGDSDNQLPGVAVYETVVDGQLLMPEGEVMTDIAINYMDGPNSDDWQRHVASFDWVNLGQVYDGIDIKMRAYANNVEKLFYVSPGSDPGQIRLKLDGLTGLTVAESGELVLKTVAGELNYTAPVAWQEIGGQRIDVDVKYQVFKSDHEYGFSLGQYDQSHELIIDPLIAATYLSNSNGNEFATSLLKTSTGVYVMGGGAGTSFPTTAGAYDSSHNGSNTGFVSLVSNDLTALLASTYLGNSWSPSATEGGLAVGPNNNNIYVALTTDSNTFPVTNNAFDTTYNGGLFDSVIAMLSPDLTQLISSTYLGGLDRDSIRDIDIAPDGTVCVTGLTSSSNFPVTAGAFDTTFNAGNNDAFVSCLSEDLSSLSASTFLGGANNDTAHSIFINVGSVFVGGTTSSTDFPTSATAFDTTYNGSGDAFVSFFTINLQTLLSSTYLGSSAADTIYDMKLHNAALYVTGYTEASVLGQFPFTPGAVQITPGGGRDMFLTSLDPFLTAINASTLFGGPQDDYGLALEVDSSGQVPSVYALAAVQSSNLPTSTDAIFHNYIGGHNDAMMLKFSADLTGLEYSSYFGTDDDTGPNPNLRDSVLSHGFFVDSQNSVYFLTQGSITTPGVLQQSGSSNNIEPTISHLVIDPALTSQVSIGFLPLDVDEAAGLLDLNVTRLGDDSGFVSVDFMPIDLTAGNGFDYSLAAGTLEWAPGDSNAKTISIPIIGDDVQEGNEQFQVQLSNPIGATIAILGGARTINIIDDDTADVVVMPTQGLSLTELPDQESFDVVLTSEPANPPVFITFSSNDTTEGQLLGAMPNGDLNLSFNAGNWDVPQTVVISSVNDDLDDGDQLFTVIGFQIVNPDPFYNGINVDDVDLITIDDDTAGFEYTPVGDPLVTTEAGGIDNFNLRLTSEPEGNVSIGLSLDSNGVGEGMISPISLMFDAANWDSFVPVTVTGLDDMIIDGDQQYNILVNATSSDPNYVFIGEPGPLVVNLDDDAISTDLSVTVTNNVNQVTPGEVITYSVVVSNLSSEDVFTIPVNSSSLNLPDAMMSWTCAPLFGSATCSEASGNGQIMTTVSTTSGASLMFIVTAMAANMPNQQAEFSVQVDVPAGFSDSNPVDNFDMDSDLIFVEDIFSDGFETP